MSVMNMALAHDETFLWPSPETSRRRHYVSQLSVRPSVHDKVC